MQQLILALLVSITFTACSSKMVKEPVADNTQTNTPSNSAQEALTPSPEANTAPAAQMKVNPLKDPNSILSKRSVYFDFDSDRIKDEFRRLIAAHANFIRNHPEMQMRIEGNADDRGSREYNLALGQKRAAAIKQIMSLLGVEERQLETISYGEEKPKAFGQDEASWAENRRGDIVYSGE